MLSGCPRLQGALGLGRGSVFGTSKCAELRPVLGSGCAVTPSPWGSGCGTSVVCLPRYMSLSIVPGTTTEQLPAPCKFLAAACSDGSVR